MSLVIVFICHNNDSINRIIHYNHYIMFVGNEEIDEQFLNNEKIIIARNLENNIEYEKKLLTFTAWYAISKNNLFKDYEYICILEYDTCLDENFENNLKEQCKLNQYNVITFNESNNHHLINVDADENILKEFLSLKDIDGNILNEINSWGCSSNQCITRMILDDFVDWYCPSYLFIKEKHFSKLSYYHERLFMIYLKSICIDYIKINGLSHSQSRSHGDGYNETNE